MNGIDDLPLCPNCGGLPTIYRYYQDRGHPKRVVGLLCGKCRKGPDPEPGKNPLETWIDYAAAVKLSRTAASLKNL